MIPLAALVPGASSPVAATADVDAPRPAAGLPEIKELLYVSPGPYAVDGEGKD